MVDVDVGSFASSIGGAGIRRDVLHELQVWITKCPCDLESGYHGNSISMDKNGVYSTRTLHPHGRGGTRYQHDMTSLTYNAFYCWITAFYELYDVKCKMHVLTS